MLLAFFSAQPFLWRFNLYHSCKRKNFTFNEYFKRVYKMVVVVLTAIVEFSGFIS